jgi:Spy/CpxP family protein refolding chaperone
LKIWLVLLVVFGLGFTTGAALNRLYVSVVNAGGSAAREPAIRDRFEKMRHELNLTDEQTTGVRTVLDDTRNEYSALRNEFRPRFDEPRLKARARIRSLLTSDQQLKFDALVGRNHGQLSQP